MISEKLTDKYKIERLSGFLKTIRFNNWWHYKIPPLIAIFFFTMSLSKNTESAVILSKLILLIAWMIFAASFGYFVNDWSDIEEDQMAGKENFVGKLSLTSKYFFPLFFAGSAISFQLLLNHNNPLPIYLSITQLVLFILYSVPPIRLKKYEVPAVICDSLYAHVLPSAIVFTTISDYQLYMPSLFFLVSWQFFWGIRNILLHHIFDRKFDAASGNSNLAIRHPPRLVLSIVNFVLMPLDFSLSSLFLFTINPYLVIVFWGLIVIRLFMTKAIWKNSHLFKSKKMSYWLLNDVDEGYLPMVSLIFFSFGASKIFLPLPLIYTFAFPRFLPNLIHDIKHYYYYLKSLNWS